ncbi:MAG: LytR C-terminal domain-containing protein, partial [Cyanobacteria bacterium J06635_10]
AGYGRIFVAKSWSQPLKSTRIVAQQGDENSAESVRSVLGFGEVRVESTGSLNSDITIQLGEDWLNKLSAPESSDDIPLL